jgi:Zn-dependent alcohol dehydrogenase
MHHGSELLDRWVPRLMKPIVKGVIDVESLITTECSLSEVDEAMKRYDEDESQVKIALSPQ